VTSHPQETDILNRGEAMRIDINTNGRVKDKDIRAMFIIGYAFTIMSERMRLATLQFFADRYGYTVEVKR